MGGHEHCPHHEKGCSVNILLLGPDCSIVTKTLLDLGHIVSRTEEPVTLGFLTAGDFRFGVSYRYRHILSRECVDYFKGNIINMHISYLPWNKGSDPNLWSWLDDTPRGVTIHRLEPGLDSGAVFVQEEVPIDAQTATLRSSYAALSCRLEALFVHNIKRIMDGTLQPVPQSGRGSYHNSADKKPYLPLLEDLQWDTPVRVLLPENRSVREQESACKHSAT